MAKEKISPGQLSAIEYIGKHGKVRTFNSYLHYGTTKALERRKIITTIGGYARLTKLGKSFFKSLKLKP